MYTCTYLSSIGINDPLIAGRLQMCVRVSGCVGVWVGTDLHARAHTHTHIHTLTNAHTRMAGA
jgi:hypothetical protein